MNEAAPNAADQMLHESEAIMQSAARWALVSMKRGFTPADENVGEKAYSLTGYGGCKVGSSWC